MEPFPFLALRLAKLPKHFTSNRRQFCDEILTDFAALVQLEAGVVIAGLFLVPGVVVADKGFNMSDQEEVDGKEESLNLNPCT